MHDRARKYLLGATLALTVLAAALPAAATATTQATSLTSRGLSADVSYSQVSGCVQVAAEDFGFGGFTTESRAGRTTLVSLVALVEIVNTCDPNNTVDTLLGCETDSGTVNINQNLSSAALSGTLTCVDLSTGEETCQLSKSETLHGIGDISTDRGHFQFRSGGFLFNEVSRGRIRQAEVTSATITGCGISLTEQDAGGANLQSASSATISVIRS